MSPADSLSAFIDLMG